MFIRHVMVEVANGIALSVSQYGRVGAKPVLYLHGGPGAGCHASDVTLFEHLDLHIFFIDQRGCGRSLGADLADNTLPELVEDIERVRQYFAIEQWAIVGGSYGATLGWLYSGLYPNRVSEQVYWGMFLANEAACDWLYGPKGAAVFFPDDYHDFQLAAKTGAILSEPMSTEDILLGYSQRFNADNPHRQPAASSWNQWEQKLASPNQITLVDSSSASVTLAVIEHHHAIHHYFSAADLFQQINGKIIAKTHLIQGELDWVCPAHLLHDFLQQSQHHHLMVEEVKSGYHSLNDAKMLIRVMQSIANIS